MTTRLIVNADDFGLSEGVCRGILEAHKKGIVTSTSVLAGFLEPKHAEALNTYPSLGRVVHLTLTVGRPVLRHLYPSSKLGPDGRFPDRFRYGSERCYELAAHVIRDEFRAQIEKMLAAMPICGLDTHHHIHELPEVFDIVLGLAGEYGLAVRTLDDVQREACRQSSIPCPDAVILEFFGPTADSAHYMSALESVAGTVDCGELVCHPAYVDELLAFWDPYLGERELELATLTDPHTMAWTWRSFTAYRHPVKQTIDISRNDMRCDQ